MTRIGCRQPGELRPVRIAASYLPWAESSALIEVEGAAPSVERPRAALLCRHQEPPIR